MLAYTEWVKGDPSRAGPDIFVGGPACQPFTAQRSDRKTKPQKHHELYNTMFGDLDSYISAVTAARPAAAILEQVKVSRQSTLLEVSSFTGTVSAWASSGLFVRHRSQR